MKNLMCFLFNVIIYVIIFIKPGHASDIKEDVFPETKTFGENQLILNGTGIRTYLFVDVYQAGLYLPEKNSDAQSILKSPTLKAIKMFYFREVSKSDLNKVWKYSFEKICKPNCKNFEKAFLEFYEATIEVKKGTEIHYIFHPQYVEIINPDKNYKISYEGFAEILLATWIGDYPPTEKLKNGLLGRK